MNDQNPFLEGWLEGRRVLIKKLRSLPAMEIPDQLDEEDSKDRRTAWNLKIKVKPVF